MFTLSAGFLGMVLLWRNAEVQRIQAEADFRVANEVLEEIVDLSTGGKDGVAHVVGQERFIDMLAQTRRRLRELAARRTDDEAISRQLVFVDRQLCMTLMQEGRWDKARLPLEESVANLNGVLRRNPDDPFALSMLSANLLWFASVAEHQGRSEESVVLLRRTVRLADQWVSRMPGAGPIDNLVTAREALALSLANRGDLDESGSLMRANRLLLDRIPEGCENSRILALRIHVQSDFSRLIEGASSVPSVTSCDLDPARHDPLTVLASPKANRLPAKDWAELAAGIFGPETSDGMVSSPTESVPPYLCELLAGTASKLRRLGRFDEARRVTDRFLAFAGRLVARYPKEPGAPSCTQRGLFAGEQECLEDRRPSRDQAVSQAGDRGESASAGPGSQPRGCTIPTGAAPAAAQGSAHPAMSHQQSL